MRRNVLMVVASPIRIGNRCRFSNSGCRRFIRNSGFECTSFIPAKRLLRCRKQLGLPVKLEAGGVDERLKPAAMKGEIAN